MQQLRQRHVERTKAMISFTTQNTQCREMLLLRYFGEQAPEYCGHCDVCLSKRQIQEANLSESIIGMLAKGSVTFSALVTQLPGFSREQLKQQVRQLIDRGAIVVNDQKALVLPASPHRGA
ncbi:MAG: hypothetical protein EBZ77_05120 [Chitinophagia bacterium]|nr:hypothetical protein [Chitinophagia bacterium]